MQEMSTVHRSTQVLRTLDCRRMRQPCTMATSWSRHAWIYEDQHGKRELRALTMIDPATGWFAIKDVENEMSWRLLMTHCCVHIQDHNTVVLMSSVLLPLGKIPTFTVTHRNQAQFRRFPDSHDGHTGLKRLQDSPILLIFSSLKRLRDWMMEKIRQGCVCAPILPIVSSRSQKLTKTTWTTWNKSWNAWNRQDKGYSLTRSGIQPQPKKVEAIMRLDRLKTIRH